MAATTESINVTTTTAAMTPASKTSALRIIGCMDSFQ
jgi:hypothetical protein